MTSRPAPPCSPDLTDLSGAELHEDVARISALGNRFCGTEGERRARDFLLAALTTAGAENVHLEPVPYLGLLGGDAVCEVVGPAGWALDCVPLQYTAAGVAEGPALYLGEAEADDFDDVERHGGEIAGRIVVAQPSLIMQRAEALAELGAAAIININPTDAPEPGHFTARFHPTPDRSRWKEWPLPIPGVTITRPGGHKLVRRIALTPTRVRIEHQVDYADAESANVVAVIPGEDRTRVVVVGAHYDTQRAGVGASDNATGLAVLLALARIGAKLKLRRSLVLAAFACEETGVWGANAFAADKRRAAATVGMVNLDAMGSPMSASRTIIADPRLTDLAVESARQTGWVPDATVDVGTAAWSDCAPFSDAGIPAAWLFRYPPHHPYYHTAGDVPRHVDAGRLRRDATATINLILRLTNLPDEHPLVQRVTPMF